MIGYQFAPSTQSQVASSLRAPIKTERVAPESGKNGYQATSISSSIPEEPQVSLKRDSGVLSSLSNHIKLINQSKYPASSASNSTGTTSTQTTASSVSPQLMQSLQSPSYHSSGSSPASSVSSPVSSSSAGGSSITHSVSLSPLSSRSPVSPNLLDYYPDINQDGLALSWFHEANTRAKLSEALMSNKMLVSGDISLAEMSRYPVPIMARPPLGVSDITLENWLQEVVYSQPQKGIKLTFTSTRTVEPAFRVLARHADQLKGPLILSADILARPSGASGTSRANRQQQQQQPVDAWTFLMLCRTRFPKSIISIGWCASALAGTAWAGAESIADSSSSLHSSADSMFELDMVDAQPNLAHLAISSQLVNLQHRLHHQLQPYPQVPQARSHRHSINHHFGHQHHILSSTGSLNSSSGNSSGSPSPTSPISQLMSPPHQTVPTNLSLSSSAKGSADSTDQLFMSTEQKGAGSKCPSSTAAAAAAMAAAVVAATSLHQQHHHHHHHHHHHQQIPLNLNINEADQQLSASSLSNLVHKIHSYQSLSHQATSSNLTQTPDEAPKGSFESPNCHTSSQHVHKKTALSQSSSNTPSSSPSSSSSLKAGSHLLLKTTQQQQGHPSMGYTREMIDKMASLVKEYNLSQPVTFPVDARMLKNSLSELQRLLYQVGNNSTLTVVAQQQDLISVDDLLTIRKAFASNQVLFDLPDELAASFKHELDLL